ncbi:MAG: retropepsin-like aspartic protease [Planctomycetota bacterium]
MPPRGHATAALLVALLLSAAGCGGGPRDAVRPRAGAAAELHGLIDARAWFELRDALERAADLPAAERAYFEARRDAVFNRPGRSSERALAALASGELVPAQALALRRLLPVNDMRRAAWDDGLASSDELLRLHVDDLPPDELENLRNTRAIFAALAGTAPRSVEVEEDFLVAPDADGRIPLLLEGESVAFTIDTGANLSVAMRSVAERASLELRPAGITVGTSTGGTVEADLAVAGELRLGGAVLRNVPFLVFPDELLSFEGGFRIPGLVGFGELEALGEVRFLQDGSIGVRAAPPANGLRNMALDGLDAIVTVECLGAPAIARVDTGANVTVFYEPFLRRHRAAIEAVGREEAVRTGGVGGVVEIPSWRLPSLTLVLGGEAIELTEVDVYRDPLPRADEGLLDVNLGRDVLEGREALVLDFRSMSCFVR